MFVTKEEVVMTFEDLRIVDLDEQKSHQPDARKAFYHLYLKLSALPPEEWRRLFETRWNILPRRYTWRHAWVEGEFIIVHCAPEELDDERYQILRYLKEAVSGTNYQYRQFIQRQARPDVSTPPENKEADEQIAGLKQRLRFD
jgi:hypothetical protein